MAPRRLRARAANAGDAVVGAASGDAAGRDRRRAIRAGRSDPQDRSRDVAPRPRRDARDEPSDEADGDTADPSAIAPERGPLPTPLRLSGISLLAVAIVASAIGTGGTMFWVQHAHKASPAPVKSATSATAPQAPPAAKTATPKLATTKDGDLAPGIDGSAADNDLSYVFRRQPTFYRTLAAGRHHHHR